jgi:hypothetical protein
MRLQEKCLLTKEGQKMVCVNKWNSGKYEIWEMGEDYVILKRENGETFKITRKEFNFNYRVEK